MTSITCRDGFRRLDVHGPPNYNHDDYACSKAVQSPRARHKGAAVMARWGPSGSWQDSGSWRDLSLNVRARRASSNQSGLRGPPRRSRTSGVEWRLLRCRLLQLASHQQHWDLGGIPDLGEIPEAQDSASWLSGPAVCARNVAADARRTRGRT